MFGIMPWTGAVDSSTIQKIILFLATPEFTDRICQQSEVAEDV